MRKPARPAGFEILAQRRPRPSRGRIWPAHFRLLVGRAFGGYLDFDEQVVEAVEPEAVALQSRRRVHKLCAVAFNCGFEPRQVLGITSEGQMIEMLAGALDDAAPAMIVPKSSQRQRVARSSDV